MERGISDSEALLRRSIPVFVNSFEQPSYLKRTLDWFRLNGFGHVTVIDQCSKYPPLLDYYGSDDFHSCAVLHRLPKNVGPRLALDVLPACYAGRTFRIFTDPDLELPERPAPDFVSRLIEVALRYSVHKVGLALDISEPEKLHQRKVKLPGKEPALTVFEWEQRFWKKPLEPDVYLADVDTTFHLYNPFFRLSLRNRTRLLRGKKPKLRGVRLAGEGFLARHLPWYLDDQFPVEEKAFFTSRAERWSNWVNADAANE
ncbi:hypothetical protein JMK10_04010 [Rhodovulum sulfidophilum]|uniref:hypothetical protein n=1 Tax=Rhodovulum sulfidophilum TaxID=35806 RepID=UPI001924A2AB|nr:hypothetical protein [Rhodovulum sulfidophilum]MBL3573626.1 hypothetical protein [Rhodovulum sulfidophilum]MCE8430135.1 hypothetical protein [Rhodovulum sulfidophilum]MCF4115993.1 hypothetical protein [Rhodovulum sulfidophilum]